MPHALHGVLCMYMAIQDTLKERGETHGDFAINSQVTQEIKGILERAIRREGNSKFYSSQQMESLDMIAHKLGRIVAGDPSHKDHWDDIAGYATLVANTLSDD